MTLSAADAITALQAQGATVARVAGPVAARRYGCQTLRYVINGQAVNLGRLRELGRLAAEPAAAEPAAAEPRRPLLPGETEPPAAPTPHGAAEPTLPQLRADAAAGRPVSLSALARAIAQDLSAPAPAPSPLRARAAVRAAEAQRLSAEGATAAADAATAHAEVLVSWADQLSSQPTGSAWEGQPWDPGTPEARARVALQGERVATLWPIAQAVRGEGHPLPGSWASDGPVMAGEWPLERAIAALSPAVIRSAAVALAALPPVTAAQARALWLCRRASDLLAQGLSLTAPAPLSGAASRR